MQMNKRHRTTALTSAVKWYKTTVTKNTYGTLTNQQLQLHTKLANDLKSCTVYGKLFQTLGAYKKQDLSFTNKLKCSPVLPTGAK